MKTFKFGKSKIFLHNNDLSHPIKNTKIISIDTETTGLSLVRDRLCLIQIGISHKECHLVKFDSDFFKKKKQAKNLQILLNDKKIEKIFHYARFDTAIIKKFLDVSCQNIFCTKIASKLVRTYTDRHGLKDLCKELLEIDLNKSQQLSDWSSNELSENQIKYAAYDVIFLFDLRKKLKQMLLREERDALAKSIFTFLPNRVELDFLGWLDTDIFSH